MAILELDADHLVRRYRDRCCTRRRVARCAQLQAPWQANDCHLTGCWRLCITDFSSAQGQGFSMFVHGGSDPEVVGRWQIIDRRTKSTRRPRRKPPAAAKLCVGEHPQPRRLHVLLPQTLSGVMTRGAHPASDGKRRLRQESAGTAEREQVRRLAGRQASLDARMKSRVIAGESAVVPDLEQLLGEGAVVVTIH